MSDKVQQNLASLFKIQTGSVKTDTEQANQEAKSLWTPIVNFFTETDTEKIMRTQGLNAVINSYEYKIQEIKNVLPDDPAGKKINLLG